MSAQIHSKKKTPPRKSLFHNTQIYTFSKQPTHTPPGELLLGVQINEQNVKRREKPKPTGGTRKQKKRRTRQKRNRSKKRRTYRRK